MGSHNFTGYKWAQLWATSPAVSTGLHWRVTTKHSFFFFCLMLILLSTEHSWWLQWRVCSLNSSMEYTTLVRLLFLHNVLIPAWPLSLFISPSRVCQDDSDTTSLIVGQFSRLLRFTQGKKKFSVPWGFARMLKSCMLRHAQKSVASGYCWPT